MCGVLGEVDVGEGWLVGDFENVVDVIRNIVEGKLVNGKVLKFSCCGGILDWFFWVFVVFVVFELEIWLVMCFFFGILFWGYLFKC